MQEGDKKKSNVFGIPYVVILFLAVVTVPSLASDHFTRQDIKKSHDDVIINEAILNQKVEKLLITATPTATPSAVPTVKAINAFPTKNFTAPTGTKVK